MKSWALCVPRERAEGVRRQLDQDGLLRHDLRIVRDGERVCLPVRAQMAPETADVEIGEREFEAYSRLRPRTYRESAQVPPELLDRLPRSYDVIGEVVLIRLPEDLRSSGPEIGAALLEFVPGSRLVGADDGVHGPERRRVVVPLAGTGPWRTVHRENGIDLVVDVSRAYFSPRLAREHARVAEAVQRDERVFDLCCGVGPFSLLIARLRLARETVAVDSNPEAISLLQENLSHHGFADRVRAVVGRVEDALPSLGLCDRAVLNLPHDRGRLLPIVAGAVVPRGTVHYYEHVARPSREERRETIVRLLGPDGAWQLVEERTLHPYSPGVDLVSYTLKRFTG